MIPRCEVVIYERNPSGVTQGFGVVFSGDTLDRIAQADPALFAKMSGQFALWDDIDIRFRGQTLTSGGHAFAAISRHVLIDVLGQRCLEVGAKLVYGTQAPEVNELLGNYDLVVVADGVHSSTRQALSRYFNPQLDEHDCKYVWLGLDKALPAFTFDIRDTRAGVMQLHGYPYSANRSTIIVEMSSEVWKRAGFSSMTPSGEGLGTEALRAIASHFPDLLNGDRLMANRAKWESFTTVTNRSWRHRHLVLVGDAAHTAHFSIGSGTKLAMEDASALAACLNENVLIDDAISRYETERRPIVESTQRAARASLDWFENVSQYIHQEPEQFAFNLLTRSRRVTYDNLRLRDPGFVDRLDEWFAQQQPAEAQGTTTGTPPMFQPFILGGLKLANRVVVSPMDMYVAENGVPTDFHLVHLGGKALGGAGLVMTEMVCVSPTGRITPGCTGLWNEQQTESWARLVEFVHRHSQAKIGVQIGHSGAKGSTRPIWDGIDMPLENENWPVAAASAIPYIPGLSQVPRELNHEDMNVIKDQFIEAAVNAVQAGFDLIEIHCAHGYLLSGFLSPLTNRRSDRYGGSAYNRARFPVEVIAGIRAKVPDIPIMVRISATDWHSNGTTSEDALIYAERLSSAGACAIDVSTGQVTSAESPSFGRSYQTPFSDAIRNKSGATTLAVGAISSYDDVNSIILAGRADLCAVGRTHLYNPNWTLHAAADQNYTGGGARWPQSWQPGSRRPPSKTGEPEPPSLARFRSESRTVQRRWLPRD